MRKREGQDRGDCAPVFLNFARSDFRGIGALLIASSSGKVSGTAAADVAGGEAGPQDQPNRWPSLRQGRICLPSVER
jgi:hypothetical protein